MTVGSTVGSEDSFQFLVARKTGVHKPFLALHFQFQESARAIRAAAEDFATEIPVRRGGPEDLLEIFKELETSTHTLGALVRMMTEDRRYGKVLIPLGRKVVSKATLNASPEKPALPRHGIQ